MLLLPIGFPQPLAAPSIGLPQPQGTLIYFVFITPLFRTICKNESCNLLSFVTAVFCRIIFSNGWNIISLSTHQLMDICIASIFFPSVNNTAIHFCVHGFLWTYIFISFAQIPKRRITGSSKLKVEVSIKLSNSFQSDCTILHSYQQYPGLHTLANFCYCLFQLRQYFIVVLICIFPVSNNVSHLCMCFFANQIFSSGKCLCRSLVYFKTGCSFY